jgi:hypothetical protein
LINLLRPVFFCFFFFLTALNWVHVPFVQDDFGFSIIPNLLPLLLTAGIDTLCPAQTINHFGFGIAFDSVDDTVPLPCAISRGIKNWKIRKSSRHVCRYRFEFYTSHYCFFWLFCSAFMLSSFGVSAFGGLISLTQYSECFQFNVITGFGINPKQKHWQTSKNLHRTKIDIIEHTVMRKLTLRKEKIRLASTKK